MSYRGRSSNRGSSNRGRSNSQRNDRPPRRRSYEDIEREAKEDSKRTEAKIEEIKQQDLPKPNNSKVQSLVSKGQQWFNKFFGGIKRRERGNMQLEFNMDLDLQINDVYQFRLSNLAFSKNYYDAFHVDFSDDFFRVYLNFLIGIKLLKANTDTGKVLLKEFQPLTFLDIKVPKNLGALINGIGKTDVAGENVVRIIGQNSIIKTMFFKSVMITAARDEKRFFNNMLFADGKTYNDISGWVTEHLLKAVTLNLYTEDRAGIERIHTYGKKAADFINKLNINLGKSQVDGPTKGKDIFARVPYFDPKWVEDIDKILLWMDQIQIFFTALKFDAGAVLKSLGYALMGWMPLKFIRNKKTPLKNLDDRFKNTIFADITPEGILLDQKWYSMNEYMDESQLYDNIVYVIQYYKSSIEDIYDDIFQMVKYEPTEFGNGSQICVINDSREQTATFDLNKDSKGISFKYGMADNKIPANTHARITDEEAVLGSVFNFNLGIFVENSFEVRTIGSAREIRLAYLGHDFK